ncbi:MAG TPA: PHB depolymerase family esterase [Candidatus Baltobacteraceae bacterium]|jgi:poly(3-hydroxybutyrate) depolymerase
MTFRRFLVPLGLLMLAACSSGSGSNNTNLPVANAPQLSTQSLTQAAETSGVTSLPSFRIDPGKVFVAGISSGGFFAVQMQVAHSATFKGAAVYAGGVYYCAQNSVAIALAACGGEGLYAGTLTESEAYLDLASSQGLIDNKSNLAGQPVYLWSGANDTVVNPKEMNDLQTEYEHYGARPIVYDSSYPAEHGWESPEGSLACGTLGEPYMIACDRGSRVYDSEQTWLQMFFGRLSPRNNGTLRGQLVQFNQSEFGATASNSMDTTGYVYVPRSCAQGQRCGLVVAFHGCLQTQADIGNKYATESGIDPWADSNGIIVLYPYAIKSATVPYNPQGCWDWWGYDDPNYSVKSGTQISIVYKMIQRLMGQ